MSRSALAAPKVNNAKALTAAKAEIRRKVFSAVASAAVAAGRGTHVFDAYAGAGEMYEAVWKHADRYVGCDLNLFRDGRTAYVGDNRRVLRAIDLQPFNIFDLDAYGSPWEQALIIAANRRVRPGELLGVALTEGSALKLKLGGMPNALRLIAGVQGDPAGLARESDRFLDLAIEGFARRLKCEVALQWRAVGKTGARMRYVGIVFRGREVAPQAPIQKPPALPVRRRVKVTRNRPLVDPLLDDPGV